MRRILALVFVLGLLLAGQAEANQRVHFDLFPQGALASAVRKAWRVDPKYAEFVKDMGEPPEFIMGLYDINGDGRPEVFARHSDDLSGFCLSEELDNDKCLLVIYANTERGLIKIAEIPVADEIIVGSRRNHGVRDLIITQPDGSRKTYIWDGKAYVTE